MNKNIREQEIHSEDEEQEYTDDEIIKANEKMHKIVMKWLDCDDKIKDLSKLVKEQRKEKATYEKNIIDIMKKYNVENTIKLTDGKLIKQVTKTKLGLKEETIEKSLSTLLKNPTKAREITDYLLENRPSKEREYLKRSVKKKPSVL
jgi:hypothetical protein